MIRLRLQNEFLRQSSGARGEISLFRAFIRAFNSLGSDALAQEFHGNRYQVKFSAKRGAGRAIARCELCDVMIISYKKGRPQEARVTFNQAKVSSNELQCNPKLFKPYNFRANLEQWDLLSNRPLITATTPKITLPCDLLSNALLPSVGTFGVFYPINNGFDFAYFVADKLTCLNNNDNSSGTLQWNSPLGQIRSFNNYDEITSTCCMFTFGSSLDAGLIGTPIRQLLYRGVVGDKMQVWLRGILLELQEMNPDSDLPKELINGLDLASDDSSKSSGLSIPRGVVLVRTE